MRDLTQQRDGWVRLVDFAWVAFAVVLVGKGVFAPGQHTVYGHYATAAGRWWAGTDIYQPDRYLYSPTFAVCMTPFALLPVRLGMTLFTAVNVFALYKCLQMLARRVLGPEWSERRTALFVYLAGIASMHGLWVHQINSLAFVLCAYAGVAAHKQRGWTAAWLLAAAVWIKLWPMPFALLLVASAPRLLAARLAVCLTALAAAPFLTAAPGYVLAQYEGWFEQLTDWGGMYRARTRDALAVLPFTVSHTVQLGVQLVTGALVLAWCLRVQRLFGRGLRLLTAQLAIWPAWQLLFGPAVARDTFGLVAPMTSWAVVMSFERGRGRTLALAAWITITTLGEGVAERALTALWPGAVGVLPLGVALYVVWLLRFPFAKPEREPDPGVAGSGSTKPGV
ncbi:MAG: glycosyltransferase family 87 protein [Planctomycetota bacterium]|nr:glycosyltransferase family 87 protein [Planctomycetota bacterium]